MDKVVYFFLFQCCKKNIKFKIKVYWLPFLFEKYMNVILGTLCLLIVKFLLWSSISDKVLALKMFVKIYLVYFAKSNSEDTITILMP